MSAVVCKCVVETNYIRDRDGKIIGKQLTEPKRFLSVPECPKCGKPYFAPAPLADKALAERLAEFAKSDCRDNEFAKWCQTAWQAYSTRQLITLAEAQEMVAAERERCAVIVEANMLCGDRDGSEVLHPRTNPGNKTGLAYAAAIRAAATGTKEGE